MRVVIGVLYIAAGRGVIDVGIITLGKHFIVNQTDFLIGRWARIRQGRVFPELFIYYVIIRPACGIASIFPCNTRDQAYEYVTGP